MHAWVARKLMRQNLIRVQHAVLDGSRQGLFVRADLTERQHKIDDCIARRAFSINEALGHDFPAETLRSSWPVGPLSFDGAIRLAVTDSKSVMRLHTVSVGTVSRDELVDQLARSCFVEERMHDMHVLDVAFP